MQLLKVAMLQATITVQFGPLRVVIITNYNTCYVIRLKINKICKNGWYDYPHNFNRNEREHDLDSSWRNAEI